MSAVLSTKQSIYETITAHIIQAIADGVGRAVMPWHGGVVPVVMPRNAATEMPYHGVNVVALWATAAMKLYPSGYWASYEQWRKLGAQVRKGERGSPIIFYKKQSGEAEPATVEEAEAPRVVLRHSHVFNFAQVEGWDLPEAATRVSQVEINEQVAAFISATRADIRHRGLSAFYDRVADYIAIPPVSLFTGSPSCSPTEGYYSTLLHELTHWTGAAHRLDRVQGKRFADPDYVFEELVAELGAAFLCSALHLVNEPRPDHAAYINHWLALLARDSRAIFAAASHAQRAVEYLRTLTGSRVP